MGRTPGPDEISFCKFVYETDPESGGDARYGVVHIKQIKRCVPMVPMLRADGTWAQEGAREGAPHIYLLNSDMYLSVARG